MQLHRRGAFLVRLALACLCAVLIVAAALAVLFLSATPGKSVDVARSAAPFLAGAVSLSLVLLSPDVQAAVARACGVLFIAGVALAAAAAVHGVGEQPALVALLLGVATAVAAGATFARLRR